MVSLGNNLIEIVNSEAIGLIASDLINVNPDLGPLEFNGGPTPTMALLPGSPAINAGNGSTTAPAAVPTPVHEWNENGNSNDSVGTSNGTPSGSGVSYAPGIVGQALQLNGSSYVTLPSLGRCHRHRALLHLRLDQDHQQRRDHPAARPQQLQRRVPARRGRGKVYWWDNANNQFGFQITSNASVADGQWHQIVAVREANGTGEIFIDGQLDSSQAGPDVALGSGLLVYLGADERNAYYGSSPMYFNGLIDQVGIYNQAL